MATIPYRWQRWLDLCIFLNVTGYFAWQTWQGLEAGRIGILEGVFVIHSAILCLCFLLRTPARAIQTKWSHQVVAIVAFYSGAFFMGPETTDSPLLLQASWWALMAGMAIGLVSLVQLGKSFGVLIAIRTVRTAGLYGWVRHPMYLSDIVMRLGFLLSHPSWRTSALFLVSSACYVLRAILEERFLLDNAPDYAIYMDRVRYRFVPGIF
ncbi:MAG: isoprenylcysteine carboxylmethyltransferase family protein [Zoogloeaceae bacterium]|jgi:protein-S-isoprenylcysteine O-methyltransferase Ste14|nr:isoprenylcysteine carboxylmethyltransferase family protein [Zoogloeaceae bacterium]